MSNTALDNGKNIFKSSRHSISCANTGKQDMLRVFVSDMRDAVWLFVDYLWETRIEWNTVDKKTNRTVRHVFDVKNNEFDAPNFISTTEFSFNGLSARASNSLR